MKKVFLIAVEYESSEQLKQSIAEVLEGPLFAQIAEWASDEKTYNSGVGNADYTKSGHRFDFVIEDREDSLLYV